nr:MAG TPA: hypothetical protein [Caudoviricetes sp.]
MSGLNSVPVNPGIADGKNQSSSTLFPQFEQK